MVGYDLGMDMPAFPAISEQSHARNRPLQFLAGFIGSPVLALFGTLIIAALAVGGVINMPLVKFLLVLALVIATSGMFLSLMLFAEPPRKTKVWIASLSIAILAADLFCLDLWIERNGPNEAKSRSGLAQAIDKIFSVSGTNAKPNATSNLEPVPNSVKSNSAPLPNVQEPKLYFTVERIETGRRTPNTAAFSRFFAKDYIVDSTIGRKALTLIPIDVVIEWSLINPSAAPITVESYEIRVQKADGSWTKLCPIGKEQDIYATDENTLSRSQKVDMRRSGFDRLIKFKALKSGEPPLRGFSFFTYSEKDVLEDPDVILKRRGGAAIELKVFTSNGHTTVATPTTAGKVDNSFTMEMSDWENLTGAQIAPRFWWCSK